LRKYQRLERKYQRLNRGDKRLSLAEVPVDEGRKRMLWMCAAIPAAPKSECKGGENDALQTEVTYEAISRAERVMWMNPSRIF
jgi:hypothetical protein